MTDTAEQEIAFAMRVCDPNELPKLWPQLEPLVVEACKWSGGQYNARGVVDAVLSGEYRLIVFEDDAGKVRGMMFACVSVYPTGVQILDITLASGEAMKSWLPNQIALDAYAKENSCASIRMIGREGLQRFLTGWKRTAIVLEREIE